jgi:hypothetical protein
VKRDSDVPEKFKMKEKMRTKEGEEEYAKYHSDWVMKGQKRIRGGIVSERCSFVTRLRRTWVYCE